MKNLFILYCLAVFSFSCNQKQNPQQSGHDDHVTGNSQNGNTGALVTAWEVKGCAEKANKGETKFKSGGEYDDFPDLPGPGDNEIIAGGDSIAYSRFVRHGCCRKAEVSITRQEKVITIIEYWTGSICKCMCSSTIKAKINKLTRGEYQVYAVETGTDPITDKPSGGRDTVMRQQVTIK